MKMACIKYSTKLTSQKEIETQREEKIRQIDSDKDTKYVEAKDTKS